MTKTLPPADESGWMQWSGGENPVGDAAVEVKWRNGRVFQAEASNTAQIDWSHDDTLMTDYCDIIAFRLAPTAPVEASGSERDAFEKWYCEDAATVGIKMLPIEILALREGDAYGAKRVALNSKWEAWQARAALDRG